MITDAELEQAIQDRAYAIWEENNRPSGKAVDHWMQAEAEITGARQDSVSRYRAMASELVAVHMRLMQMEEPLISRSGPVRRLSSVIRSAAALLMVPINLAVPNTIGAFLNKDSEGDYRELLISIYRCTLTGAHIYFEDSLHEWCERNSIPISNSLHRKWASARTKMIAAGLSEQNLKLLDGLEPPRAPTAPDIVRAATSVLSKDRAAAWSDYLDAVAIIRNKLSHSRPSLSVNQQDRLRKAGLGSIISEDGLLSFNAHMLPNTIQNLIDFFGEIEKDTPTL